MSFPALIRRRMVATRTPSCSAACFIDSKRSRGRSADAERVPARAHVGPGGRPPADRCPPQRADERPFRR
jgi:hypothetical protein